MTQRAYDKNQPNGSGRNNFGDRTLSIFRLYQRTDAAVLGSVAGEGIFSEITRGIRTVRNTLRQGFLGPLQGRVLIKEYRFVMILESSEKTPEVRTSFRYVREGYYLDTPIRNALGVRRFRLAGTTHWTPVYINGLPVDGDAALKDWQEMIEDYFFPKQGSTDQYELVWMNMNAPISAEDPFGEFEWLIHPVRRGITERQVNNRPLLRRFDFEFLGLQSNRDLAKAEDGLLAGMFSRGYLGNLLEKIGLGAFKEFLGEVFGAIDEFEGLLSDIENVVTAALDYVTAVQQAIQAPIAYVRGVMDRITSVINRVNNGIDMIRDLPNFASDQYNLLRQGYPGLAKGNSSVPGTLLNEEGRKLLNVMRTMVAQPLAFASPLQRQQSNAIALRVKFDTTLEEIAASANVSPDTIIAYNNLQYPFLVADERPSRALDRVDMEIDAAVIQYAASFELLQGRRYAALARGDVPGNEEAIRLNLEMTTLTQNHNAALAILDIERIAAAAAIEPAGRVLYAGDLVRMPVSETRSRIAPSIVGIDDDRIINRIEAATGVPVTEEERLFGIDFHLSDEGNLVWDPSRNDIRLERGLDNVKASILRYLRLRIGELRYAPGVGNFAFDDIASWQGPGQNRLLQYSIYKTLNQDPRVREVENVTVDTEAGVAKLTYDAVLINGEIMPQLRSPIPE